MKQPDPAAGRTVPRGPALRLRAGRGGWAAALAALALATTGCDVWYNRVPSPDDLWHVVPWFDHMIQAKYIHPYQTAAVPRYTPAGTVPVTGGEPDWSAEWTTGKTTTADALKNPYAPAAGDSGKASPPGPAIAVIPREVEAAGDTMFQNYCAVCHGTAGDAKGPVSSRIGAPSLLTGRARAYSDGYLYSIIRYGRGVMPRYGDKVYLPSERWAIVNHIRKLQGQVPAGPEAAGASAGIAPGPSATGSTGERPR
ncbi:MAG TPA: cytochrome c [Gemmatimonadales bacterium]|nr:cytochrome c [Gemmatimonadales bacterium]